MILFWIGLFQVLALFADYLDKEDASIRIGPITSLGLAYAGTKNEQVGPHNCSMIFLSERVLSMIALF